MQEVKKKNGSFKLPPVVASYKVPLGQFFVSSRVLSAGFSRLSLNKNVSTYIPAQPSGFLWFLRTEEGFS